MRVSIPWLKTLVDIKQSAAELADTLTMLGLEAEMPDNASFSGIIVGKVLKADKFEIHRLKLENDSIKKNVVKKTFIIFYF